MKDLYALFREKNIDRAFQELGLNWKSLFPEKKNQKASELYGNHEWLVKKIPQFGTIINAVPPDEKIRKNPWEEWYVLEKIIHHHVLHLDKPASYDEVFNAPDHDDIHPSRTLGKKWYVIDDKDMSPVLLR